MEALSVIATAFQLPLKKRYPVLLALYETLQRRYLRLILDLSADMSNPKAEVST